MAWAPNPPNFYRQFTKENLDQLQQFKREPVLSSSSQTDDAASLLHLPPELRYLVPPPLPASGDYRLFGTARTTRDYLRPLAEQEIQQLYPETNSIHSPNRSAYLKLLTRSILLSFLELIGMLSQNPADAARKQDEIKTMYLNALHLINEYRPHQARESLILRMENEVERGRAEVAEVKRLTTKIESLMTASTSADVSVDGPGIVSGHNNGATIEDADAKDEGHISLMVQRSVWTTLDAELVRT